MLLKSNSRARLLLLYPLLPVLTVAAIIAAIRTPRNAS